MRNKTLVFLVLFGLHANIYAVKTNTIQTARINQLVESLKILATTIMETDACMRLVANFINEAAVELYDTAATIADDAQLTALTGTVETTLATLTRTTKSIPEFGEMRTHVSTAESIAATADTLIQFIATKNTSSNTTLGNASTALADVATMLQNATIKNNNPTSGIVSRLGNMCANTISSISSNANLTQLTTIALVVTNARTLQSVMDYLISHYKSYNFNSDCNFAAYASNVNKANNRYNKYVKSPSLSTAQNYINAL